jgi:hypothetical protein
MTKPGRYIGMYNIASADTRSSGQYLKWDGSKPVWDTVDVGDSLSFNGNTANGVLTYGGASQIDVESSVTISGTTLGNAGGEFNLIAGTNLQLFGGSSVNVTSGRLEISGSTSLPGTIKLYEDTDNGTNAVTVTIPASCSDQTITLPDATGTVALTHFAIPSDGAGNADGDIVYIGTGSTVIGKIYYYKSDGSWGLTNSNDPSTATGWLAVALGTDPDVDGMLVRGMIDLAGNIVGTEALGSIIYLDKATAGDVTTAAPTATGDIVRVIGYAVSTGDANKIWFNPDNTWVEHV